MAWLGTPQCLIDACSGQISKLEAEEAMTEVATLGVGTGAMGKDAAKKMIRRWSSAASSPNPRPKKAHFNLQAMSSAGIGVPKMKKS